MKVDIRVLDHFLELRIPYALDLGRVVNVTDHHACLGASSHLGADGGGGTGGVCRWRRG